MKTILTLFIFTRMIIVNEGNSFTLEKRKCIDSAGAVELTERVKMINDSVAVQRRGNQIYYYIK